MKKFQTTNKRTSFSTSNFRNSNKLLLFKIKLIYYLTKKHYANYQDITKFVKGTHAAKSPIIPISAQSGLNIDALIGAIESQSKLQNEMKKRYSYACFTFF